ncbi:hypothetical protein PV10_00167 [Exophiala mesophila]|uniref:S-adenosylmethionine tRNA ribosyltransferase n=1 Tax=Exophiala mesophila TaxID=212818 RepID=A0A0D1ZQL4_EXOME|nr:uncharacterized protein PV10_00167 [Exophiala mesophila]KIV96284.1 hypothetical protein PV10_00167 [Exophiala mesophila]
MTSPTNTILTDRFSQLLQKREHPQTLCPSEVARSFSTSELETLKVASWRDLMPQLRQMSFQARDRGEIEILQRGELVSSDCQLDDVRGPIRIRKVQDL